MRQRAGRMIGVGVLACLLAATAGCSHSRSVGAAATSYNRAFAQARNEQLLLNIVRASAREPLQFTAFGEVNASVDRSIGIDTVAENLIAGGANVISPTLSLGRDSNAVIRIAPLGNREFTDGILRPVSPEQLSLLLAQGWDAEFLLPLVIGSVRCGDSTIVNSGEHGPGEVLRERMSASAGAFRLRRVDGEETRTRLTVASSEALQMVRTAPVGDFRVVDIAEAGTPGHSVVTVARSQPSRWQAEAPGLCPGAAQNLLALGDGDAGAALQLRSVEGILYFLGEVYRACYLAGAEQGCALTYRRSGRIRYLLRLSSGRSGANGAAVSVDMYDRTYWIPRLDAADEDRTLKTIEFLHQLIALQTNGESTLTPAVIALPN